jgi:hypothetical protein
MEDNVLLNSTYLTHAEYFISVDKFIMDRGDLGGWL